MTAESILIQLYKHGIHLILVGVPFWWMYKMMGFTVVFLYVHGETMSDAFHCLSPSNSYYGTCFQFVFGLWCLWMHFFLANFDDNFMKYLYFSSFWRKFLAWSVMVGTCPVPPCPSPFPFPVWSGSVCSTSLAFMSHCQICFYICYFSYLLWVVMRMRMMLGLALSVMTLISVGGLASILIYTITLRLGLLLWSFRLP